MLSIDAHFKILIAEKSCKRWEKNYDLIPLCLLPERNSALGIYDADFRILS